MIIDLTLTEQELLFTALESRRQAVYQLLKIWLNEKDANDTTKFLIKEYTEELDRIDKLQKRIKNLT